jgi:iron complex outermembrane receptor protein
MFKTKPIASGLALAFGGLASALIFAGTASAQQSPPPADAQKLDRVEVTGSLIPRIQGETALPVSVIRAEDLRAVGVTNAQAALTFVTQNQTSLVSANSVGSSNGGASYADLRGLGVERTLVLLNGQRIVNNPYSGVAVDLNTIPFNSIDRIEVLAEGASSLYGADAIAGVVNFITRREYQGFNIFGSAQIPQDGGGEKYTAEIGGGYGTLAKEGWNIYGALSYNKQNVLVATDRSYADSGIKLDKGYARTSGTTFPGNYSQSSTNVATNPTLPNCAPSQSVLVPSLFGSNTCRFDFTQFVDLIPEQEQTNLYAKGTVALGSENTFSLEYFWSKNTLTAAVAPTPLTGLPLTAASPYYPGGTAGVPVTNPALNSSLPISVGWRTTSAGQRASEFENTTQRVLGTLDGTIVGWGYNLNAYYSSSDVTNTFTGGYVNRSQVIAGLAGANGAPFLNPFGSQTSAGADYLNSVKVLGQVQDITGDLWGANLTVNKEIANLPAGPLGLALGVDYRKQTIDFTNNFALIRQAASSGLELAEDTSGNQDVYAFLAELHIPVIKDLNVNLAVRYDKYSDFSGVWSPKVSAGWQALNSLLVRGSYNQGFRAPSVFDLYSPNSITNTANAYDDPVLCPNGNPVPGADPARDCGQQFNQQQGGNTQTQPEESDSWSVGFVLQPTATLSLSVDYWNTKVTGLIGALPDSAVFGDPSAYANKFVRCSQLSVADRLALQGTCSGQATVDPLAYVIGTTENLGDLKASGIDFNIQYKTPTFEWGKLNFGFSGTYLTNWEQQLVKNGTYYSALGQYSTELDFPAFRFQSTFTAGWQYGPWGLIATNRFKSSYFDQNDAENLLPGYDENSVGALSVWDLVANYSGIKGLILTAGVQNLFNQDPPFSNQGSSFQVGYDPRYASPLGRTWLLQVAYQFK